MGRKSKRAVLVYGVKDRAETLSAGLREAGCEAHSASDPKSLREVTSEELWGAVVLLDSEDSGKALKNLRRANPSLALVAVSDSVADEQVELAAKAGADLCLPFPAGSMRAICLALEVAATARAADKECADLREQLKGVREQLEVAGFLDPLSGAYNNRFLDVRLAEEIHRARRYRRALSILVADLDDHRAFRARHGDRMAEYVIRQMTSLLRWGTRPSDCICRIEVDKFVVILPETTLSGAISTGEKVRRSIQDARFVKSPDGGVEVVTCSVGCAELTESIHTAQDLLTAAEAAVQDAKLRGKNIVRW